MIFPRLPIHTHIFFPKKYPLTSECSRLVDQEESLLVRRFLIKTPLGKPQRLLVKLLLLLLNNKNTNTKIYNNEANYSCYLRSQVSAIFSMRRRLARLLLYLREKSSSWPSSHRSGTLHEARALRLHHCFDKIIEQF